MITVDNNYIYSSPFIQIQRQMSMLSVFDTSKKFFVYIILAEQTFFEWH